MAEEKDLHADVTSGYAETRPPTSNPLAGASATPGAVDDHAYWREAYQHEPYYLAGYPYAQYLPAYELGWRTRLALDDDFDSLEPSLARDWEARRADSNLTWPQARPAARAAWERAHRAAAAEKVDNDDLVDTLNDLMETCHDGEFGFNACAEHTKGESLRNLFKQRARECREAATELQEQVIRLGGEPAKGGSTGGALHRGWVAARGRLMGFTDQAMLDESERGEDIAVEHYRSALGKPLSYAVRAMVQRHLDGAQRNHDQIKSMRDMHASQSVDE